MAEALGHPRLGYYRDALPSAPPATSPPRRRSRQMFGELIGAWLAERWLAMGRPPGVRLVELGPGTRHPDGRCLARHARRAGLPCRASISISSRSTSSCAPCRARRSPPSSADLARTLRRRARRAAAAGRQRVLRRPAGAPVREDRARLDRAHGRPRTPTATSAPGAGARRRRPSPPALPDAPVGAQAEICRGRACAGRRDRRAPRAPRRLGADRRLRP